MGKSFDSSSLESRSGKRILLGTLAMVLIAVLLVGGTFAYFTSSGTASAQLMLTGGTAVELVNNWTSANGSGEKGVGLFAQDSIKDVVKARNTGQECYLRVRMRITKDQATGGADQITLEELRELPTVDDPSAETPQVNEMLDLIVSTLYNDTDTARIDSNSETDLTPRLLDNGKSVKRVAYSFTRDFLKSTYGYLPSSSEYSYPATRNAASSAGNSTMTLKGAFKNVTTKSEYDAGLFTFEYVGGNNADKNNGKLSSNELSSALISTICIPRDCTTVLVGGTDDSGDDLGYTITFWAESVPSADYEDRQAAMNEMESIFPAERYYTPLGSS